MDVWQQILIIKYLIILSVCFNVNAVAPETLESRSSEKQSVKRQLPANRSKRQGSRPGYNDFWHYLIDRQAYFADEHLPAHKPYGPYKPYDMHVLPPYGVPHSSGEIYDDYADSFHPNVGIFPDFQQPPTIYNGFGMQPNFFSPLGLNIHSRPQTVRTKRPLAYSFRTPPRNPNCNSNRCQSVTNPNLCYQSHRRRPHVKGDRNCRLQSYRKTKCGICQQNGKHCNLNDANQISSENSTHIIVMHLGENNCSCTHYIKKATGVSDTDCDSNSKIEINSVEVLDDAISIPIATTEGTLNSTETTRTLNSIETTRTLNSTETTATIPSAEVTTTSSALNSASSKSPTKDSQSSPYLSPSNEPAFKTKVSPPPSTSSNPRALSVTPTKSPSENNIVQDSSYSIAPEFNSNVPHRSSIVSKLGAFSNTDRSTSEENIVQDSTASIAPEFKSNIDHRPSILSTLGAFSTTARSTSEENIVLDSNSSIKPEFNSNNHHRPSSVSTLGTFSTTSRSNSDENIVLDSNSSIKPESNSNVPHRPSIVSTLGSFSNTSRSTSEENIVQDSTASIASEFNSNVRHRPSMVSILESFNNTALSTSEENIVFHNTSSTTVQSSSSRTVNVEISSFDDSALTSTPSSSSASTSTPSPSSASTTTLSSSSGPTSTSSSFLVPTSTTSSSSAPTSTPSSSLEPLSTPKSSSAATSTPSSSSAPISTPSSSLGPASTPSTSSASTSTPSLSSAPTSTPKSSSAATSTPSSSSAPTSTPSSSSESIASTFKTSSFNSFETHSAAGINTSSTKKIASESLDSSTTFRVPSTTFPLPTNSSILSSIQSTDSDSGTISSNTVSTATRTPLSVTKSSLNSASMFATTSTPSLMTTKLFASDSRPGSTLYSTSTQSPITSSTPFPASTSSPRPDSMPDYPKWSISKLIPSYFAKTTPAPASTISYTLISAPDAETTNIPLTNAALDSDSKINSTPRTISTSATKDTTFGSSSKLSRVSHQNTSSISQSSVVKSNISSYSKSSGLTKDSQNLMAHGKGPLLSSVKADEISPADDLSPGKDGFEITQAPIADVTSTSSLPAEELKTSHNKNGRVRGSSVASKSSIEETLAISKSENMTAHTKEERVISSVISHPTTLKEDFTNDDLEPISNLNEDMSSTSALSTAQGSKTIHNNSGNIKNSFENDNSNSKQRNSERIPLKEDNVSSTFVLSTEQESNTARVKNERIVHKSSFASSSAISKVDSTDEDLGAISKLKDNMPSTSLLSTARGSKTIHNNSGNVKNFFEKDTSNSKLRNSESFPTKEDNVSSTFVLSTEQESNTTRAKNERIVHQSSFVSSSAISKMDSTEEDLGAISKLKDEVASTSAIQTSQGSRAIHNKGGGLESSSANDTKNSRNHDSKPISIKKDDFSNTFVLSTEQEFSKAQIKNERVVQSSFASSSAISKSNSADDDLKTISNLKDDTPSRIVLSPEQGSKSVHNISGSLESSSVKDNRNSKHHDSKTIPIHVDDVSSSFVLSQESSKSQIKNERIVQSSIGSSSTMSKADSTGNDFKPISNFKDDTPSTITVSTKQGSIIINDIGGKGERSSGKDNRNSKHHDSKTIPIHVDDVSSSFVLSTEQEASKSQIKNERVVQSSFASSSKISKVDSTGNNFKPISNFKDDTPSTIAVSTKQGSIIIHDIGGAEKSSSENSNRHSKHRDSEPIPIKKDDIPSSFVLSTEQESSTAHNQNERVVQSSFVSSSAISKAKENVPTTIVIATNQGSRTVHNKDGRQESSSKKDNINFRHDNSETIHVDDVSSRSIISNRNSKHQDSEPIPITVDDISTTFVLSTEQESSNSQIKNERVVQSSFASSSATSKNHSASNDFKPISNFREDIPSSILISTKQGSRTTHNQGGRLESSSEKPNINSKHRDFESHPLKQEDISSTFMLSTEQESSAAHIQNEKVVQSSSSVISKGDDTHDELRPISKMKDNISSTIVLPRNQGSRKVHDKGGRVESSHSETIPIHVDDVSSTFVLSTEQEFSKAQTKNEKVVQSSSASSSATSKNHSTGHDFKPISNFKDDTPSTMVLATNQGSRTIYNKGERIESSPGKDNSKHHDSEAYPIHVDDVSSTFVLSTEQESSKAQNKNERIVQSSVGSSSTISKADAIDDDLQPFSKLKGNVPSTIILPSNQGPRTIHNKDGQVESSHSTTIPIHVDDVSSTFVLSSEKESSKSQTKNERIVQSSIGSSSTMSKADSTGNGFKPISNFKDDTPSTIVLATNQGSRTIHNKGGRLESSSEKYNRNSKHHDSGTVPTHVDDVSSTFLLSTEQESSKAQIRKESVVQSSFASSPAISKADTIDDDLGSISKVTDNIPKTIVLPANQGSRTNHNKGGSVDSSHFETIPIHVDDVSSTYVVSTEQEFSKAQNKNERIVQSSIGSSSTMSKADAIDDDLGPISKVKDNVPKTIVLARNQGSRTTHNKGEKVENSPSKTIPIHVDDVSSTFVLSTEQESSKSQIKNERVVQSSAVSSSAISKNHSAGNDFKPISNVKDNTPSTIVLATNQGSRTIPNKGGRLESSSGKDNSNSKHHDSERNPFTVDNVSNTFVLSKEQESSAAHTKNERVVQSSFASSTAISKADAIKDDLGSISKVKENVPSAIIVTKNKGSRTIHNKDGKLESSSKKDNINLRQYDSKTIRIHVDDDSSRSIISNGNSKHHDSKPIPITLDDLSSTFVLSTEQESSKAQIKNERVAQSSFASASALSKADYTDDDLEPILQLKGDVPGTIELATKQGSRTIYNKVSREENSFNTNSRYDYSEPIPIEKDKISSSFVSSTEQESTKTQRQNERVVQSSFASSAEISKNDASGNDFKSISYFNDNIPITIGLPQIAGNQQHQQFGRMDLVAQLQNLEKLNQSSQFITNTSSSSTRHSSRESKTTSRAQSSNERNISKSNYLRNLQSNNKYIEEQQMKMLQEDSKETETLKSLKDNKTPTFTRVSDINSKDTKSKDLRADDMQTLAIGAISAIDLGSSDSIFSHESSEAETSRENNPTMNDNEDETIQILSSSIVREIGESEESDEGANVALNSNGNFKALQFGSAASRIDSGNIDRSQGTLKLEAGRARDKIHNRYNAPARLISQSFGTLDDQDSEEIDPKDDPKTTSGLSSESAKSSESEESISDTLKLETENVGDRRNYMSTTGSRFVHVLRSPNERYSYYSSEATFAEPLVPGVYTTKRNEFEYISQYPTTIYWRRIEPKTYLSNSRLRELRPFGLDDFEDAGYSQDCYDIDMIDC